MGIERTNVQVQWRSNGGVIHTGNPVSGPLGFMVRGGQWCSVGMSRTGALKNQTRQGFFHPILNFYATVLSNWNGVLPNHIQSLSIVGPLQWMPIRIRNGLNVEGHGIQGQCAMAWTSTDDGRDDAAIRRGLGNV